MKFQPTKEEKRRMFLAGRDAELYSASCAWRGHVRDLYHPITLSDGSYWRNNRWNSPTVNEHA